MGSDGLGHAEAAHLLRAKDLGHLLVGDEVLLVVGVLIGSVNECNELQRIKFLVCVSPEGCSS